MLYTEADEASTKREILAKAWSESAKDLATGAKYWPRVETQSRPEQ